MLLLTGIIFIIFSDTEKKVLVRGERYGRGMRGRRCGGEDEDEGEGEG